MIVHRTLVTIQNRGPSIILQHSECSQPTSPRIYVCDNEGKKKKGKQLLTGIETVDHDFISNNETVVRTLGIGSCALMPTRSTLSSKAAPNIPSREVTSLNWLIFFFLLSENEVSHRAWIAIYFTVQCTGCTSLQRLQRLQMMPAQESCRHHLDVCEHRQSVRVKQPQHKR